MSQEAVERVLGRLITDDRFRHAAADSFETACLQEGFSLTIAELRLLSGLDLPSFADLASGLNAGLCRAGCVGRKLSGSID